MALVEQQRLDQLESNIKDMWDYESILYVGACKERFHFKDKIEENFKLVDIIEIDKDRCEYLKNNITFIDNVYNEDVRNIDKLNLNKYDVIMWSHGPEMIPREDFETTINKLIDITKYLIVLMCPWGEYKYKSTKGLKYWNMTALYPTDFTQLGFNVSTILKMNEIGSNLIAWKYI